MLGDMRTRRLPCDDQGCGWIATLPPLPPARRLAGDIRADCAVLGAGFTGLAAARRLATHRPDWRVVLLEAERVGFGASGRNSGFVVDVGHYAPALGVEGNRRVSRVNRVGLEQLRRLVREHAIDCAWSDGGRLHGVVGERSLRDLEGFCRALDAMEERYTRLDAAAMERRIGTAYYRAGVHTPGSATMQPAALARGLAAALPPSVELFEESPVRAIRGGAKLELETTTGKAVADRLFLAANGFTPAIGLLGRRVFPLLTFASLTRPLTEAEQRALGGEKEWGLVPEERMGTTVRRLRDGRILIRNTVRYTTRLAVGETYLQRVRERHARSFRARFPMLPRVELEHTWGGVLGATFNAAHHFGPLAENVWAAAGCNGVGVALGTTSGTLLADLAVGADSEFLGDMRALPRPAWLPPEPLLGIGVRVALASLAARAREED